MQSELVSSSSQHRIQSVAYLDLHLHRELLMKVVESAVKSSFVLLVGGESILSEAFFEHFEIVVD